MPAMTSCLHPVRALAGLWLAVALLASAPAQASYEITPWPRNKAVPVLALDGLDGQAWTAARLKGKVVVLNFWATWCEPCRAEMPDFKALFARRADWGGAVRFLPIQIQDDSDPGRAYSGIERIMPPAPIKLADRAMGGPLAAALGSDAERTLFKGQLPVTLVLDCNRRVRWAHFSQLTDTNVADLERVIDQLRAELADDSPGAWCRKEWPGNGRCEGKEATPAGHVPEDCG